MRKIIKLIILIILFVFYICSYSYSVYEPESEEYKKRELEAQEIINSVSGNNSSSISDISDNRTVYVTTTDSKFHSYGCDELKNTPHKLTVSEAQNKGYAPCKECNPYGLANDVVSKKIDLKNISFILLFILFITYIIWNEIRNNKKQS